MYVPNILILGFTLTLLICRAVGSTNSTAVSTVPGNQQQAGGQQQQHRQQTAPSQQHQVNISDHDFEY